LSSTTTQAMEATMSDSLVVRFSGTIRQPIDVVSRQFGDIAHHAKHSVHPDITFTVLSDRNDVCHFTQEVRLLGLRQKDEVIQRRRADGGLESEVIEGTNKGTKIYQSFQPQGSNATTIDFRIEAPATGIKKLLKPLFKAAIRSTVKKAFEQDRVDLEERGYPRRSAAA